MDIGNRHRWNKSQLVENGITNQNPSTVAQMIVRNIGDATKATLPTGEDIERKEYIFVDGHGLIKCAPYELHFIYELPSKYKGWGLYCTCGSIAGVVGYNAYSKLAAPTFSGQMIVCLHHTSTKNNDTWGEHADGSHE